MAFGRELAPGIIPIEFSAWVLRGLSMMMPCVGVVDVACGAFEAVASSGADFELAATVLAVVLEHDDAEVAEAVERKVRKLA